MPSQAASAADSPSSPDGPEAGDPVGVVFGDVDAASFRFAVHETGLGQGDWVAADHPGCGAVLARVESVRRESDLGAEDARRLDDPEADAPDDHVTAEARVVGSARGSGDPPSTPVPAGAAVRRAPGSLLATALGLPEPDGPRPRGAYLGKARGRDVDVVLDVEDLVRRHLSVLAKTGAGKSYLVGVLLEELAKEGVPAVVVDPHGEHDGLARPNRDEDAFPRMRAFGVEPRQYADALERFHPDPGTDPESEPLRLEAANLPRDELEQLLGDLTNAQQGLLHQALRTLRDRPAHYTLEDVRRQVEDAESSAKWNLLSSLETLADRPVFQGEPTDPSRLVARGQVSLVNLRGVDPETAETAVARLANTLFEARKRGEIPPFLLVVEEAHRFCPERGFGDSAAGPALRTVASEGRKFGMGCAIVSQRPAKVDKNVLSQCNTEVAMKVTNPRDVKALASSLEGLTDGMADEIQRLPVGQAVVSHPGLRTPVVTEIRPRETRPGGDPTPVVADGPAEAAGDAPAPTPDAFPGDGGDRAVGGDPEAGLDDPPEDPEEATPEGAGPEGENPRDERAQPEGQSIHGDEPADPEEEPAPTDGPAEGPAPAHAPPETALEQAAAEPDEPREGPAEGEGRDPAPGEGPEAEVDAVLRVDPDGPDAAREDKPPDEPADRPPEAGPDDGEAGPDEVLDEAARTPGDPDEAGLDEPASEDDREPRATVAAVREAEAILAGSDPADLRSRRLRSLVDEVEDLLARLGRVGDRTPEVVEAHNALAAELVRYRRDLAGREATDQGILRR